MGWDVSKRYRVYGNDEVLIVTADMKSFFLTSRNGYATIVNRPLSSTESRLEFNPGEFEGTKVSEFYGNKAARTKVRDGVWEVWLGEGVMVRVRHG